MNKRAKELIKRFNLIQHPEGGYFREVYRSEKKGMIDAQGNLRSWMTDIYFLLTQQDISRFHRVEYDEIWHFYEGAPVIITEIQPDTLDRNETILGRSDLAYKHCIRGNNWQSARSLGKYSLVGCTMSPGFEFDNLEIMAGDKDIATSILRKYPDLGKYI